MNPENQTIKRPQDLFRFIIGTILVICLAFALSYGWMYIKTPAPLRKPQSAHYHLRLQIINNGKPVEFGKENFQTPYDKYSCSVNLPEEPIHLHDNINQFVHIHWQGITGGMILKNYGWNEIGDKDDVLGYRFDQSWWPHTITIHGNMLPQRLSSAHFYLYTGDQTSHRLRNWPVFLNEDLELFFNDSANLETGITEATSTTSDTEHTRVKHMIGNAILFVQENPPTETEVQSYFNNLIPLPESICGG
jgi:hypothetical protein